MERGTSFIGIGVALGVAIGAALGVAMNNLPVGIGMGVAIGAGVGLAMDVSRRKRWDGEASPATGDSAHHEHSEGGSDSGGGD